MDLKVYTLEELEPYLYILYSKPESLVPVSPLRLISYLRNPRARMSDPVLFEMRQSDEVVAYRTLLPDSFYDSAGQPQRFAWLSGNWVRPDKRRQGISTRLLEMAQEKWKGHLMYTNYAPVSKEVYDSTGHFSLIARRDGLRFYLRSAAEDLLGHRTGSGKFLGFSDRLINQLREKRIRNYKFPSGLFCQVNQIDGFIAQLSELVRMLQQDTLFRRDREIFEWALEYPWVTEQACDPINYHFSYKADRFENILLQFSHPEKEIHGILWIILHNRVLSVPYFFSDDPLIEACMAETIVRTMVETDCTHTTIRNAKLLEQMKTHRKIFLSTRKMPQLIFAHRDLMKLLPENRIIHDGDGDVMFTG
jgi:hypothetical protein